MSEKSPWEGRLGVEVIGKTQGCCVDTILKWRPQMVGQKRTCQYCNVTMKVVRAGEVVNQEFTGGLNEYRRELPQPELVIGGLYFSNEKFPTEKEVGEWLEDREVDADQDVVVELDNFASYVALERLLPDSVRSLWVAPGVVGELGIAEKQVATGGGQASMHSPGVTVASMNAGTLHPAQGPAAISGGTGKMPSVLHGATQMTDGHQHEFHLVPFPSPDGWRVKGFASFGNGHTHMIDAAVNTDGSLDARTAPDQAPVGGHAHNHRIVWHDSMNLPGGPPPNIVPADTSNDGTTGKDFENEDMLNEFRQQLSEAINRAQVKIGKSLEGAETEKTKKGQKVKPGSLKGGKSEPSAKAPAGGGQRFQALSEELASKSDECDVEEEKGKVRNPKALAAAIGRAKYGKKKFQEMAAAGRRKANKALSDDDAFVRALDDMTDAEYGEFLRAVEDFHGIEIDKAKKGQKVKPGSLKGGKSEPSAKAPAGGGKRFEALSEELAGKKGVQDPKALAAALGRAKYGKKRFQEMAASGRKKK